ncbi:TIGR04104 family putative zinc finger protein [Planococcus sp. CP5-4_YE]|uniref:TIGR04104 family putative zinc finger protein n=2 Tax=Planococcus TaxID=1372 RepID=UPI00349F5598
MPRCQHCGYQWSWKDVMKLSLKSKRKCQNCHKIQYISAKSNFWTTFLTSMAFLLPMNFLRAYYEISWLWIFLAIPIYIPLVSLLMPFFYKLSNTQKRFGKTVE